VKSTFIRMEFMGFSCAEFVNKALLSLMLLVWTTAASAQTRSDANAVRQNEFTNSYGANS
jgi:hypothetical protein